MAVLLWQNADMPPGVGDPVHVRKFIIRNLGDPEQIPTLSQWDGAA